MIPLSCLAVVTLAAMVAAQDAKPAAERLLELRQRRDAMTPQQRRSLVSGEIDALLDAYLGAAKAYGGDQAAPFLLDALELAPQRRAARDIVNVIAADYSKCAALDALGPTLPTLPARCGVKPARDLFVALERDTPSPRLRAWATLARLQATIQSSKPGAARYDAAKTELLQSVANVDDADLHARCAALFARECLALGAVAPDIAGLDLDGIAFKLSDYKGKVVLLDFWGDW